MDCMLKKNIVLKNNKHDTQIISLKEQINLHVKWKLGSFFSIILKKMYDLTWSTLRQKTRMETKYLIKTVNENNIKLVIISKLVNTQHSPIEHILLNSN